MFTIRTHFTYRAQGVAKIVFEFNILDGKPTDDDFARGGFFLCRGDRFDENRYCDVMINSPAPFDYGSVANALMAVAFLQSGQWMEVTHKLKQ